MMSDYWHYRGFEIFQDQNGNFEAEDGRTTLFGYTHSEILSEIDREQLKMRRPARCMKEGKKECLSIAL